MGHLPMDANHILSQEPLNRQMLLSRNWPFHAAKMSHVTELKKLKDVDW